jgi:hypothetical protein
MSYNSELMSTISTSFKLDSLGKQSLGQLVALARQMGKTPQSLAKELLKSSLDIEITARTKTFDQILAPLRKSAGRVNEAELIELVDRARTRYHKQIARKKK